jgi:hypothetical protein
MAESDKDHFFLEISDLRVDEYQMQDKVLVSVDPVIGQRRVCNYVFFVVGGNVVFFTGRGCFNYDDCVVLRLMICLVVLFKRF